MHALQHEDPEVFGAIHREIERQNQLIEAANVAKLKGIWNEGGE